jgi:hypothetical protein
MQPNGREGRCSRCWVKGRRVSRAWGARAELGSGGGGAARAAVTAAAPSAHHGRGCCRRRWAQMDSTQMLALLARNARPQMSPRTQAASRRPGSVDAPKEWWKAIAQWRQQLCLHTLQGVATCGNARHPPGPAGVRLAGRSSHVACRHLALAPLCALHACRERASRGGSRGRPRKGPRNGLRSQWDGSTHWRIVRMCLLVYVR